MVFVFHFLYSHDLAMCDFYFITPNERSNVSGTVCRCAKRRENGKALTFFQIDKFKDYFENWNKRLDSVWRQEKGALKVPDI